VGLLGAIGILAAEAAAGFLALDLIFRTMSLAEDGLRERVRRLGWFYAGLAALLVAGGGWLQWRLLGAGGAALLALDWAPWWLLWRFGLRKQLGFLFWNKGAKKPTSP